MIFGEFCKISVFIEKREKRKKRERLGLGPAHNEASPTIRI
jgi:hypothetical protein